MNKAALIHHDNVPEKAKELFQTENIFRFEYLAEKHQNLDACISNEIIDKLKNKDIDIVFIKDNLSTNYLELYGLGVAYHIRLSKTLKDMRFVPIVILSDIDGCALNKIEPIAKILFTKNIFLAPNTKETVEKYTNNIPGRLSENEYQSEFLDRITVESSENTTSHSIANEWAIYRWAKYLNAQSEAITKNKNKIISMLYFKYLNAKYPLPKKSGIRRVPTAPQPVLSEKYKILYIDDEWAKGWADIFDTYFSKSESIDFETYQYNFIDKTQDQIIDHAIDKIKTTDPDLILLDLRLSQSDHTEKNIDNLTGIKLIEHINSINKGIQVIMLSATGKSLTLEKMHEKEILGYIKKDRPGDLGLGVADNYDRLKLLVNQAIESQYLKKIWQIMQDINSMKLNKLERIKFEAKSVFKILDSNLGKRYIYAMLSIYQSIEEINNYYIDDKKGAWIDTGQKIEGNNFTKNKIEQILSKRLKLINIYGKQIERIAKMRKNIIHPPSKNFETPTKDDIVIWFEMLNEILKRIEKK